MSPTATHPRGASAALIYSVAPAPAATRSGLRLPRSRSERPTSLVHMPHYDPPVLASRRPEGAVGAVGHAPELADLPAPLVHLLQRRQVVHLDQRRPAVDHGHRLAARVEGERPEIAETLACCDPPRLVQG